MKTFSEHAASPKKFFLWALPAGQTDRLHERPLTSMSLTADQLEKVKTAASKDGWHGFRSAPDSNDLPDFTAGLK